MIHVIAIITTLPGERATVLRHFNENRPHVLAEAGCIEYGAVIDAEPGLPIQTPTGPDTFMVIEKWASLEALKAHGAAPHMATYAGKTRPLLAQRVIHVLQGA
jgi:quinol monooxygenase YgiN